MPTLTHPRVETARAGTDPAVICRVPSGWVFLCNQQFLSGYAILTADPVVDSLNALSRAERAQFMDDMGVVGDALLAVTGACRINYAVMGNSDPVLHAHIIPRYLSEPEERLHDLPWLYEPEILNGRMFDPLRDRDLMDALRVEIHKRL